MLDAESLATSLFPTMLVGSYPQPGWLIDRERLAERLPPRVRASELWQVPEQYLKEAQDDAVTLAVREQEAAGLDIVTDGEVRRESYSNHFATALDGVDVDNPGTITGRSGRPNLVPRVVGDIVRKHSVHLEDAWFLRLTTEKPIKVTLPGPFTMSQQAQNEHYADAESLAMAFAEVCREEARELFSAGVDIVQLDEPYLEANPESARDYGLTAINHALEGLGGTRAVHLCFGYAAMMSRDKPSGYSFLPELADAAAEQISIETAQPGLQLQVLEELAGKTILLGVLDLSDTEIEEPELIAERVRRAYSFIPVERIVLAPDCGMKYLPRHSAEGKLRSMVAASRLLREEEESARLS